MIRNHLHARIVTLFWTLLSLQAAGTDSARPNPSAEIQSLIGKLGARDFKERESAELALIEIGEDALPQLSDASQCDDPDLAERLGRISGVIRGSREKPSPVRAGIHAVLTNSPGSAIVACRIMRSDSDHHSTPMNGFRDLQLILQDPSTGKTIRVSATKPSDQDGMVYFPIKPGTYGVLPWSGLRPSRIPQPFIQNLHAFSAACGKSRRFESNEVAFAPDIVFVPCIRWISPQSGSQVSLAKNPKIEWESFPGVKKVRLTAGIRDSKEGREIVQWTVRLSRDGSSIQLSEILKDPSWKGAPPTQGIELILHVHGFAEDGSDVSESAEGYLLKLAE